MSKIVRYQRYGGPEVLDIDEIEEPHAGAGQVRVAVRAAGLNFFDTKVRRDAANLPNHSLPSGQGLEFAGVIDEVGAGAESLSVGDEVLGWVGTGAQAEYVVVPFGQVARKPRRLDWVTAAGIGLVANTARRATDAVSPSPGDTILVSAAAGGVGLFAAQFALRAGARVIGTASTENHAYLRSLGIVPVVYGDGLADRLRAAAPEGIDAVIDGAGEQTVAVAVELGVPPQRINTIAYPAAAAKYGIQSVGGGKKTAAQLAEFAELVANGELRMPIAASFPLDKVRDAYVLLESRHLLGKVVLTIP